MKKGEEVSSWMGSEALGWRAYGRLDWKRTRRRKLDLLYICHFCSATAVSSPLEISHGAESQLE